MVGEPRSSARGLRHGGDRDREEGESEGPLLLLARGPVGIHDRASNRRGASNSPWRNPSEGCPCPGSGFRSNPVLERGSPIRTQTVQTRSIARRIRRNSPVTPKPLLLHARRFYYMCHPYG